MALALGLGLWQLVAVLGVLKAGGAYLPLDVALPEARLELMLREAGVRVLLTEQRLRERFTKLAHVLALDTEWESVAGHEPTDLEAKPGADNLAYVIYTSGSTGTPKAVMIEHGAMLNLIASLRERIYGQLGAGQRVSLNAPLHFDASVKQLVQLTCGHTLCVVPETVRLDGAAMRTWVKEQALTVLDCTPAQLRLLLEGAAADWMTGVVLVGGEAIEEQLWQRLREQNGVKYYNVYGPTECTVDATACAVDEAEAPVLGRALPGVRVYVLDPRQRLAPIGVAGELYIGGRGVGRGYLGRGDLTAERYVPDEWSGAAGARLYATGDVVRFVEGGALEYVGRADRQVKVRGHRVELGEIETVLREHAGVGSAVVELGAEESLVAYVVRQEQGNGIAKELREHVRSRLPEYMRPGRYVEVATMPLTRSGKVDREELRRLAESNGHSEADEPLQARPRTPVEEVLTGFWAEILGIEHVNVDDNFFELGGHSLLVTRIISRVRKVFQVEAPILALFESPTVSGLAAVIEKSLKSRSEAQTTPVERIDRNGEIPLSFSQQRLWFLQQLTPNSTAYHLPSSFRLTGPLHVEVLEQTLQEIITRHEVLRTTFATVDSRPVQTISPPAPPAVTKLDLSDWPEHEREQEVRRQAFEEATRPFDLAHGPLLRATLLRLGDLEHVVLFTMHHIASDEWSMEILVREVATLYESFLEGQPSPLPELPIQYADYATWQQRQMHGEVLEANMKYWRERLGGDLPVLQLPIDRPRPPLQTFRGAMRSLMLPVTLLKALRTLSRKEGVTLFMTLLGAFQTLLHRYSGQEDILTGTPIANRNRLETEGLIGFFVNTLVMRTDMSGDPTFNELLARVRADALGAYAHQDLPFEKLVEELKPRRDLSRNPIFQVAFTYESSPRKALALPGLTLSPLENEYVSVRFDLVVLVSERDEGLKVAFNYNTDLFNEATINKMLAFYELILQNVVIQPEIRLSRLVQIVNEAEREQQAARQKEFKEARRRMLQNLKPKLSTESLTEAEGVI